MDQDDKYVKQLEGIFDSFCCVHSSVINKAQLEKLCTGLSLNDQCTLRLCELAFPNSLQHSQNEETIDFNKFCDCFVVALSDANDESSPSTCIDDDPVEVAEVKPRLVRGGKAYGRKSLPFNHIEKKCDGMNDEANVYQDDSALPSSASIIEFQNDDNDEMVDFYCEPIGERRVAKEDYFEARGSAEIHPQQKSVDSKLRRDMSTSMIFDGIGNVSTVSITGGGGVDLFASLTEDDSSLVEIQQIVEFWRKGGVTEYQPIFEALNIDYSDHLAVVDGFELSNALEREVMASSLATLAAPHHAVTSALFHSLKHHLLRTDDQLHHYRHQVGKIKEDLERSEMRNSKIMEEVDDRYVSLDQQHEKQFEGMERKWSKKLQSAQRGFDRERDSILNQAAQEREELLREMEALRSSESIWRRKVDVLTAENNSATDQSVRLLERLQEAEKDADRLRNDLECLLAAKASDDCDVVNSSQEEKFAMIIKDYEAQCRFLSDRNDELSSEILEVRSQLRVQESRCNEKSFNNEQKSSPVRKKSRRRRRSDGLMEDSNTSEDDLSELERRAEFLGSNPNESLAYKFATARMRELEQLVEDLRREKRKAAESFAFEKAELRSTIEAEFRAKDHSCDDARAVEEQRAITMRLLEEATKERDEFETKFMDLKQNVEKEASSGEKKITDLCREFAQEKNEMVSKHKGEITSIEEQFNSANKKLSEEKEANQRLTDQLKFERNQHKEALAAHQEIITKFEKSSSLKNDSGDKIKEINEKHQEELRQALREHAAEVEAVKRDMEEKLETVLAEKQSYDSSSICSELDRLQEHIEAERRDMLERLLEMRESFEREAVELRQMLDHDKARLRQQLSEEVAMLQQEIAEEGQRELERRKQGMEEEWRRQAESMEAQQREKAELFDLRSEINALQARNLDLERSLSEATSSLRKHEERMEIITETKQSEDALLRRIEETKKKLLEKELDNSSLRKQLDDVISETKDGKTSISMLRMRCDDKIAENSRLLNENHGLNEQVRHLDEECKRIRIENAGLGAKCDALERSTPTPKVRHNKEKEEMLEQIKSLKGEIADLRSQPTRPSRDVTPRYDDASADITFGPDTSRSDGDDSLSFMRQRLTQTKKQLTEHMVKMKDLYGKLSKSEMLVKDLYCENSHLMRALQVTEARQRSAEQRCEEEINKNKVLGQLVKRICNEVV